jgi:hypothetical protein
MSLFSKSRCVLLLGDEGVTLYDVGSSRTVDADAVAWSDVNFEDRLIGAMKKHARGRSVVILNDMVEQHYRKERVPRASALDRANIIKRRVAAAFPSYPMRSALKFKEKPPAREADSMPGDIYLLAAVPLSDQISRTLAAVQKSRVRIEGFCLLPVESSSMVHALSKKNTKFSEKPATWAIFMGQHRNGGLRQVVTKNGELALTRMTPIIDNDAEPDAWTSEIVSELRATMSYLARFGFTPSEGLDVTIIANNSVADTLTQKIDIECDLNILTAGEAANLIGVKLGRQDDQRYADPLHAAWTGKKSALALPLQAAQLDNIAGPVKKAMAAMVVFMALAGYMGYTAYNNFSKWNENKVSIRNIETRLNALRVEHEAEVQKKATMGVDFLLVEDSTKAYAGFELSAMKPLGTLDQIAKALGPDLKIKSFEIKGATEQKTSQPQPEPVLNPDGSTAEPPPSPRTYDIVISIVFPAALPPEQGVEQVTQLEQRLKLNLPSHAVNIIKQVADLSYTGNFVGEAGAQAQKEDQPKEDYEAQISIRGALL